MPTYRTASASNVREARQALGLRLRELRLRAGLTGRQLAESMGWPQSKVSKLENGRQTPTEADLRGWTATTGSEAEAEALIASLHTLERKHAEWQRQFNLGLHPHQDEIAELDRKTRLFRVFEATVIPGLLQTPAYAHARFVQGAMMFRTPNDIDEAVRRRVQRQEVFYRLDKRFHFVLTEAALRFRLCPPDVMLGQLDRLVSLSMLPNVRLGIIGFETQYTVAPWHGFWLLDKELVMVETFSAELNLAQPQEIDVYGGVFASLAAVAAYGRAARAIITRVADELAADLPEDGAAFE